MLAERQTDRQIHAHVGWRRGVVVSGVSMNEVDARRARLVLGWMTVSGRIPSRYVTSQLGQLSLASLQLRPGVKAGMSPPSGGR